MLIVKNRARCRTCSSVVESYSVEEGTKYCKCGAIAVYGGKKALMRLGHHKDIEDMSIKVYDMGQGLNRRQAMSDEITVL